MRMRLLPGLTGLCLLLAAVPVRADDPKPKAKPIAPAVVVRVRPIESLVADARYLAELADKGDDFKMYEGIYKSMLKEKSLEGVDVSRPLGGYGEIGPSGIDSRFVILVPIADEATFLKFIESKDIKPEKDDDGSYKVEVPNSPLGAAYFRFANKYVYITMGDKDNIAPAILLDPTKVFAKLPGAMSVSLDIDKIPDELKKTAIGQTANALAELKDKPAQPGETEAQHKLQEATLDEMTDWFKMLLNDGGEATLTFDVDRTKGDLSLSLSLAGKEGTKLAKKFSDLGGAKSIGAGLIGKDSAANMLFHMALPERIRKAMEPVIDEGLKKALDDEQDKDKRAVAEKIYKALAPTLKTGEFDMGFNLRGPSSKGLYAMVTAVKVKDGAELEKAIKEIIPTLPEKDRKNVTLDFAKAGSISIHKIEGGELDQNTKDAFGEGPAYFAIRGDAVMFSLGDGALEALKDALASKPGASKAMQFEGSMNRLIQLVPKEQRKVAEEAAKKAFDKDKEADKMTLVLEAGDALKLRFKMKAALVTFFGYLAEHQQIAPPPVP